MTLYLLGQIFDFGGICLGQRLRTVMLTWEDGETC